MADHLLLCSPSISWADCGLLDQLTPTYVRQSETFPTLPPLPFSVFLSYPAPFSPIRFVATLLFFSSLHLYYLSLLFGLLSSFSLRHHHSSLPFPFLPSLTGYGSKTGVCSWEAINWQTLRIRAQLQNQTTADFWTSNFYSVSMMKNVE